MIRTTYLMTTFLAAILLTGLGIVSVSDIRFGRLGRRFEEVRGRATTDVLEQILGRPVPAILQDMMVHGADELDLVRSGLDDTMRLAYREIRETMLSRGEVPDLRTAAFVVAIEKVAKTYMEMGA